MKTTLILDDAVARRLRQHARRRGVSISRAAEDLLRASLARKEQPDLSVAALPTFHGGAFRVAIESRAALYDVLDDADVRR